MDVAEPRSRVSDLHRRAIPRGLSSLRGRSVMKPRSKRVNCKRGKRRKKEKGKGNHCTGLFVQLIPFEWHVYSVEYMCACLCVWVCVERGRWCA